jgi:cob(I)alamin adenosyltransferase
MVVLNRIYTRTGDDGTTALGTGERRPKYDLRIAAYGTVDELNAALGLVRLHTVSDTEVDPMLLRIQNDLFDLGADLCMPDKDGKSSGKGPGGVRLEIVDAQVTRLEQEIDSLNAALAPLRSFVLPGGTAAAAHLHLARTICRRAERLMVELAAGESVGAPALRYVNRLSDFLFVAARYLNDKGAGDVLWSPGANR